MNKLSYILATIENTKWNMLPQSVEALLAIAHREDGDFYSAFHNPNTPNIQDYSVSLGERLDGTRNTYVKGNTGIITINGPMIPRISTAPSAPEMANYERISHEFSMLESMPNIRYITLLMDTPGGSVTGLSELTAQFANSQKIVQTYIMGYAASAGYYLATGTKRIYSADSGEAGSIGTVMIYTSTKEADERKGIKTYEIVSSVSPFKRVTPDSDEGKQKYQSIVDELGNMFVNQVAKGRNTTPENVIQNFGQGGMLLAGNALSAGMIDEVITLKDLLERNNSMVNYIHEVTMAGTNTSAPAMSADEFKALNPEAYASIFELGATAERTRIQQIESIAHPAAAALVASAKWDPQQTKQSVTLAFAEQMLSNPEAFAAPAKVEATTVAVEHAAAAHDLGRTSTTIPTVTTAASDATVGLIDAMVSGGNRK